MSLAQRILEFYARAFALGAMAVVLSACSRTVTWEEEVPLNTGETIWIEREMRWAMRGGMGNPFDIALRPTREQVIRFKYAGQQYQYAGRANVRWIAVSPQKTPVLVARAADFDWAGSHNYYCVVPYYVQFVSDLSGSSWSWPDQIETWLYGLHANVMASIPTPADNLRRYSTSDRELKDAVYKARALPHGMVIDPLYAERNCIHKSLQIDNVQKHQEKT